jgi:hypothetical protein
MSLHADLIALGVAWLREQGCDVVLAEPWTPQGERPDVIGWKKDGSGSILIEAKTSRRDFQKEWSLTDRDRKEFRRQPAAGTWRYYLGPSDIIDSSQLEECGWGQLVPAPRAGGRKLSRLFRYKSSREFEVNYKTELAILVRAASDPQYGKQRHPQICFGF